MDAVPLVEVEETDTEKLVLVDEGADSSLIELDVVADSPLLEVMHEACDDVETQNDEEEVVEGIPWMVLIVLCWDPLFLTLACHHP